MLEEKDDDSSIDQYTDDVDDDMVMVVYWMPRRPLLVNSWNKSALHY